MIQFPLEPCHSPIWARGGQAQTVLGHLLPSPRRDSNERRLEVQLQDGDRLISFIREAEGPGVLYFFHGLGGTTDADYMHRSSLLAQSLNMTSILTNHRGCGAGAGLAKHPYHSGRGEDISRVIEEGRKLFPNKKHLAVGYSLSGNALLLLAAGVRGNSLPDMAISVNAPINLTSASHAMSVGFNRVYDQRFVKLCKESVRSRVASGHLNPLQYRLPAWMNLAKFDELYTAPAAGYRDRQDYYEQCSSLPHLKKIEIPTWMLTAMDDPFIDFRDYQTAEIGNHVAIHIEPTGGHMGYLTRNHPHIDGNRWLDYALKQAISKFLDTPAVA